MGFLCDCVHKKVLVHVCVATGPVLGLDMVEMVWMGSYLDEREEGRVEGTGQVTPGTHQKKTE